MHSSSLVNCTGGLTIGKTPKNVGGVCDLAHEDLHQTLVESITACQRNPECTSCCCEVCYPVGDY